MVVWGHDDVGLTGWMAPTWRGPYSLLSPHAVNKEDPWCPAGQAEDPFLLAINLPDLTTSCTKRPAGGLDGDSVCE